MSSRTKKKAKIVKVQVKKFAWTDGYRATVPASAAGEIVTMLLGRDGYVTPNSMVAEAKKKSSPIHNGFEWDDKIAGQRYRLVQAQTMRRSLLEVITEPGGEKRMQRVVIHTQVPVQEGKYISASVSVDQLLADDRMYAASMRECVSLLKGVRSRYDFLAELNSTFDEIDKID